MDTIPPSIRQKTAVHESAHAYILWSHGVLIETLALPQPDGPHYGHPEYSGFCQPAPRRVADTPADEATQLMLQG
jgi:hypothetical protein